MDGAGIEMTTFGGDDVHLGGPEVAETPTSPRHRDSDFLGLLAALLVTVLLFCTALSGAFYFYNTVRDHSTVSFMVARDSYPGVSNVYKLPLAPILPENLNYYPHTHVNVSNHQIALGRCAKHLFAQTSREIFTATEELLFVLQDCETSIFSYKEAHFGLRSVNSSAVPAIYNGMYIMLGVALGIFLVVLVRRLRRCCA